MKMNAQFLKAAVIAILVAITGAAVYFFALPQANKLSTKKERKESKDVVKAPVERDWKRLKLGKYDLQSDITDSLYRAMSLKRFGNHLYVSDFGDMRIKRFNLEGKYIDSFGEGKGRGPGEFQLIMGLTVNNNILYVQDPRKFTVQLFDISSTEYQDSFEVKYRPHRLVSVADKLVAEAFNEKEIFKIHDKDGHVSAAFGKIIENQLQNSFSITGELTPLPKENLFVYAPAKASYLMYYNLKGERVKTVITPDRIEFAESIKSETNDTRTLRSPQTSKRVDDITIHEGKIYVLSNSRSADKRSIVDVYNTESGNYVHSFRLPNQVKDILFGPEKMFVIDKSTEQIKAYRI